jgi:hypothetical protein
MAELVRRAVRQMRAESELQNPPLAELLSTTGGSWTHGDSLAYQKRLRDEWGR